MALSISDSLQTTTSSLLFRYSIKMHLNQVHPT